MKLRNFQIGRRWHVASIAILLCLFAFQLIHVARVTSSSWDEGHHLFDGYTIWTRHDYRANAEVPPLVKLTASLPLLAEHLQVPPNQGKSQSMEAFLDGRAFLFKNGVNRTLFPARMACMVFALALALLLYAAALEMFGAAAALLALALFIFDPNFLASGTYVTTDVASACFFFATVFAFYRYAKAPSWPRLLVTGLALGLAMTTKFTGIFLVPMLLLLAVAEAVSARSLRLLGRRLAACLSIVFVGWLLIWAFYGFRYTPAPRGQELRPPLPAYLKTMPDPAQGRELALIARLHLLPEPYIWGLANTEKTAWEDTTYFFGRVYRHGIWEYFPAVFLIKSTLPLLILLCLVALLWRRIPGLGWREAEFLLVPVAVYFAVVMHAQMDIGARHLLPVYPLLYVLAAAAAAWLLRSGPAGKIALVFLLLWQVITSVRVSPAYMAYGNEAWGGPSQVHRYLSDANVDWGQQLLAVKAYVDKNHIAQCWFAYFPDGAIEPSDYGISCHRLPTASGLWWMNLPTDVPPVISGTVFISDGVLEGIEFGDGRLNPYGSFRKLTPATVIQHGVYVYQGQFAVPLASALVDVRKARGLHTNGQAVAALAEAREAVRLAPDSATTQLALADLLASQEQWQDALDHYQAASDSLHANRPDLQEDLAAQIQAGLTKARQHTSA